MGWISPSACRRNTCCQLTSWLWGKGVTHRMRREQCGLERQIACMIPTMNMPPLHNMFVLYRNMIPSCGLCVCHWRRKFTVKEQWLTEVSCGDQYAQQHHDCQDSQQNSPPLRRLLFLSLWSRHGPSVAAWPWNHCDDEKKKKKRRKLVKWKKRTWCS